MFVTTVVVLIVESGENLKINKWTADVSKELAKGVVEYLSDNTDYERKKNKMYWKLSKSRKPVYYNFMKK